MYCHTIFPFSKTCTIMHFFIIFKNVYCHTLFSSFAKTFVSFNLFSSGLSRLSIFFGFLQTLKSYQCRWDIDVLTGWPACRKTWQFDKCKKRGKLSTETRMKIMKRGKRGYIDGLFQKCSENAPIFKKGKSCTLALRNMLILCSDAFQCSSIGSCVDWE